MNRAWMTMEGNEASQHHLVARSLKESKEENTLERRRVSQEEPKTYQYCGL